MAGFSKDWLYSFYEWKNGWKVEYNTAKKNYKLSKQDEIGWEGPYKYGTRIRMFFDDNEYYVGKVTAYNLSLNIILSNTMMVIMKNL